MRCSCYQYGIRFTWSDVYGRGGKTIVHAARSRPMETCTKIPYASLNLARRAARAVARAYRQRGCLRLPRGVHPCANCGAWHVTSQQVKSEWRI